MEWQPTFGAQVARAALLQVATHDQVFLLDIFSLREKEKLSVDQSRQLQLKLFENPHILKLGFGMKEDLHVLSRSLPGVGDISKSIKHWLDLRDLWSTIQKKCPSFCATLSKSLFILLHFGEWGYQARRNGM